MRVEIDGRMYIPEGGGSKSDVAIAITTRNRNQQLAQTLKQIDMVTPDNFPIIVVDDASEPPPEVVSGTNWHRFLDNVGIPRAKNKCIEMLMATGADHFFLLDDDCYPAIENWWLPYTLAPEPHYNYIFANWTDGKPVGDCKEVYNDGHMRAFDQARGCAIYLHRSAIERVGGFDPVFGIGMEEHLEYSRRICNAGLTTFPFQDVVGSDDIWTSIDRMQTGTRSIPTAQRRELYARNHPLAEARINSADYIEYRTMPNLVVTQLLTLNKDGQRGIKWDRDGQIVSKWANSIQGADAAVLIDQEINGGADLPAEWYLYGPGWPVPHLERWVMSLRHLKSHPAKWVWITDGSDVEMLRPPWDEMVPGILYVGDEPCCVAKPWLTDHHPFYANWIRENAAKQMLNCGLVGGDRDTVLEFLGDMVRELTRAYGQIDYEMGSFNYLLRQDRWRGRISHGPHVNTLFKADERNDHSWWKHK